MTGGDSQVSACNRGFDLVKRGGLTYLQAPLLIGGGLVKHAFSTRSGGSSRGPFSSLNTGLHVGDDTRAVMNNRRIFFSHFGIDHLLIVSSKQVHGTAIRFFTRHNRGEGARPGSFTATCDALVTAEKGLTLVAYSADCMIIYFVVPGNRPLVALAHAGWRGTLNGIGPKVVRYLEENFSVDPGCVLAALGPAICKNCYEVDGQVAEQFRAAGWESPVYMEPAAGNLWQLDLAAINAGQLLQAGVAAENMARSSFCTSCRPDLFFSYRRDRGTTGRMIAFITINGGR